jgi:hypothetical protein
MNKPIRITSLLFLGVFGLHPALAQEAPQPGPEDGGVAGVDLP